MFKISDDEKEKKMMLMMKGCVTVNQEMMIIGEAESSAFVMFEGKRVF